MPDYTLWSYLEFLPDSDVVTTSALSDHSPLSLALYCFPDDWVMLEVLWLKTDTPLDQIEWVTYRLYDETLEVTNTFIPPMYGLSESEGFDTRGVFIRNILEEIPEPKFTDWFMLEVGVEAGGEEVVQGRFLMEPLRALLRGRIGSLAWQCSTP